MSFPLSTRVFLLLIVLLSVECRGIKKDFLSSDEIIFAHTICRHGDRNIYEPYSTDPWKPEDFWPGGYAQLTNLGRKQHFKLGEYFRGRYRDLIGDGEYSAKNVYIRSTDVDRVLMSASANMAGLFPPSYDQMWNEDLDWQPIPVHTQPKTDDYVLASDKRCDHFDYIMLQYMNTTAYTGIFQKHKSLIHYLEKNSGQKLLTITSILNLFDALFIERLKDKALPEWAEKVMTPGGDFEYIAMQWFAIFTPTAEMKKLKSGYLLKEILDRFTNKTQSTLSPDRSLWMYFAHDITIANMLSTLGLFETHQPPYTSCLLFELHKSDEGNYVQIFYRNSTKLPNPPPLHIPGCGTKCPLTTMYKVYNNVLPTNSFDSECDLRSGEILPAFGNPENNSL